MWTLKYLHELEILGSLDFISRVELESLLDAISLDEICPSLVKVNNVKPNADSTKIIIKTFYEAVDTCNIRFVRKKKNFTTSTCFWKIVEIDQKKQRPENGTLWNATFIF